MFLQLEIRQERFYRGFVYGCTLLSTKQVCQIYILEQAKVRYYVFVALRTYRNTLAKQVALFLIKYVVLHNHCLLLGALASGNFYLSTKHR